MGNQAFAYLAAGLGAGIAAMAAGYGIGRIGSAAADGSSRQPEAAGDIRTTAIILAALIEGAVLFGEVICVLLATK
ncbi:MAG: ATP synthase F0 subunit C [Rhizobacter sp.]|nr:ATP synthase F0 subunit C [Chlorobiales bacterium]